MRGHWGQRPGNLALSLELAGEHVKISTQQVLGAMSLDATKSREDEQWLRGSHQVPAYLVKHSPVTETRTSIVSMAVPKRLKSRRRLRALSRQGAEEGHSETGGALASRCDFDRP